MKKIISVLLISILVFGINLLTTDSRKAPFLEELSERELKEQILFSQEYKQKRDTMSWNYRIEIERGYPAYYAGEYINHAGKRVKVVTGDDVENIKQVKAYIDHPDITVEHVEYSYNYLNLLMLKIRLNREKYRDTDDKALSEMISSIVGYGIYDDKNCIIIEVFELTNAKIELFKRYICNSGAIRFKDGEYIIAC